MAESGPNSGVARDILDRLRREIDDVLALIERPLARERNAAARTGIDRPPGGSGGTEPAALPRARASM